MGALIPIHWDDFYKSLDEPLAPEGDFDASMQFVLERGKKDGVDVRLPSAWTWAQPFLGM